MKKIVASDLLYSSIKSNKKVATSDMKSVSEKKIGAPGKRKLFGERSELCEAQETRGSKFICEFGRNSTVYCFVASGLLNSFEFHL